MSEFNLLEAEQIICAEILWSPETCDWEFLFTNLNDDCFTKIPYLSKIFNAAKKIFDQDNKPDLQAIKMEIDIPLSELSKYTENVTSQATFRRACLKLKIAYFNRLSKRIVGEATDKLEVLDEVSDTDLTNAANDIIFKVSDLVEKGAVKADISKTSDIMGDYLEYISDLKSGAIKPGLSIGWESVDKILGGIYAGQSIILGAYEGTGKSSVLLNIVNNLLLQGKSCLIFSMEMTERQLLNRLISMRTGIPLNKIKTNEQLTDGEFKMVGTAANELANSKLFICTDMDLNTSSMLHYAKKIQKKYGLDFIGIDHLGLLMQNESGDDDVAKTSYASRNIKKMAKVLSIPILTLSQFNGSQADPYSQKIGSRKLLKGSRSIEADADIVLVLHRIVKDADGKPAPLDVQETAFILIDKNRDGEMGMKELHFDLSTQKITDRFANTPQSVIKAIQQEFFIN